MPTNLAEVIELAEKRAIAKSRYRKFILWCWVAYMMQATVGILVGFVVALTVTGVWA